MAILDRELERSRDFLGLQPDHTIVRAPIDAPCEEKSQRGTVIIDAHEIVRPIHIPALFVVVFFQATACVRCAEVGDRVLEVAGGTAGMSAQIASRPRADELPHPGVQRSDPSRVRVPS
jgi:hypothetical protein